MIIFFETIVKSTILKVNQTHIYITNLISKLFLLHGNDNDGDFVIFDRTIFHPQGGG